MFTSAGTASLSFSFVWQPQLGRDRDYDFEATQAKKKSMKAKLVVKLVGFLFIVIIHVDLTIFSFIPSKYDYQDTSGTLLTLL